MPSLKVCFLRMTFLPFTGRVGNADYLFDEVSVSFLVVRVSMSPGSMLGWISVLC